MKRLVIIMKRGQYRLSPTEERVGKDNMEGACEGAQTSRKGSSRCVSHQTRNVRQRRSPPQTGNQPLPVTALEHLLLELRWLRGIENLVFRRYSSAAILQKVHRINHELFRIFHGIITLEELLANPASPSGPPHMTCVTEAKDSRVTAQNVNRGNSHRHPEKKKKKKGAKTASPHQKTANKM